MKRRTISKVDLDFYEKTKKSILIFANMRDFEQLKQLEKRLETSITLISIEIIDKLKSECLMRTNQLTIEDESDIDDDNYQKFFVEIHCKKMEVYRRDRDERSVSTRRAKNFIDNKQRSSLFIPEGIFCKFVIGYVPEFMLVWDLNECSDWEIISAKGNKTTIQEDEEDIPCMSPILTRGFVGSSDDSDDDSDNESIDSSDSMDSDT